jgi:NADH:ubiquinone oxidoreductase subunit 5 (subunit L)/multisubunit Na+/H+ antiporter MnhA subunit
MPVTGGTFLIGSVAISGLPPLNGFVSEWLIYVGLFYGAFHFQGPAAGACVVGIVSLAFIGGLAAACFAKAFSTVFLGQARSKLPAQIYDPGRAMRIPMLLGAVLCVLIGIWPRGALLLVLGPVEVLAGNAALPPGVLASLTAITRVGFFLIGLIALTGYVHHRLLRNREVRSEPTWACGYNAATARMQYTASSFAQPLLASLGTILKQTRRATLPQGYFPTSGHFTEHLMDQSLESFWMPAATKTISLFRRLKFLQQGRLQSYLLYILVTLILILLWKVR